MTRIIEYHIEKDFKLADIINTNEKLLLVIERFGISLGFGDKTIEEVCKDHDLNLNLVLIIINIFNNQTYPVEDYLEENMIPGLIDYLKNGHRYYLKEKLPYIGSLIDRFIENTNNPDTKLLQTFFKEYANEVKEHMYLEDSKVFPYIELIYEYHKNPDEDIQLPDYSINDFIEHHSDIEEKLDDLMQLLIKHFPPTSDRFYRNLILLELYNLQYDLNDHSRLEDQILGVLVRELESKIRLHD